MPVPSRTAVRSMTTVTYLSPTVAQPRSKLTRSAVWWALRQVVLDHCSISAVAAVLQTAWGTVHDAVTDLGQQVLINHPGRLEG